MAEPADQHRRAAEAHETAARLHVAAATRWAMRGDDERANLERRDAYIQWDAASLELDWADFEDARREHAPDRS